MATFALLDQVDEDKLHSTRLLTVEEKPFKRITKRLLAPTSPINAFYSRLPTPPADDAAQEDPAASAASRNEKFQKELQRFREDVILDFAAFESSIARIQFLRAANEKERERYAAEKLKIEATAQQVLDNIANLRIQLDEAQKTLSVRKTYDVLADRVTSNKALKPRDEQHANIEKLKAEIEELERESKEHSQAWLDRREVFSRVVAESARLRRLVRDEKEEPEKQDEDDEQNMLSGVDREQHEGGISHMGTPRPPPEDAMTPMPNAHDSGMDTPRSAMVEITVIGSNEKDTPGLGVADVEMADGEDAAGVTSVSLDKMDTS